MSLLGQAQSVSAARLGDNTLFVVDEIQKLPGSASFSISKGLGESLLFEAAFLIRLRFSGVSGAVS